MPLRTAARTAAAVLAFLTVASVLPSSAGALTFKVVNQSDQPANKVFITVAGDNNTFDVPGMTNDAPVPLSTIPGQTVTINKLVSGRIYVSYGAGVNVSVPFNSPTRFDWAELTVSPNSSDVANLTAVDQFGIGMRLNTLSSSGGKLQEVGSANSDTVFNAMQKIPGGPAATQKDKSGHILRVLSPNQTGAYPDLDKYVKSMAGKKISLHTAFFGDPFTTSSYSGTFASDGSITLKGSTNPQGIAPGQLAFTGSSLINDIYNGGNTPNNLSGAIYRDLLAAFSSGMWDGKYGNSSLSFCSNAKTTSQGSWCPNGFNKPGFGDARKNLSSFPTCEQYAAVINKYSYSYGNPYSDASKKVTVSLDQPASGGNVKTLQLTILPDSGNAQPVEGGNSNCGAASSSGKPPKFSFYKKAVLKGKSAKVGKVSCSSACGKIKVIAKKGKKKVASSKYKATSKKPYLTMKVTKTGRNLLKKNHKFKIHVTAWVQPSGQKQVSRKHSMKFLKG